VRLVKTEIFERVPSEMPTSLESGFRTIAEAWEREPPKLQFEIVRN
jgi:hypothetical protein